MHVLSTLLIIGLALKMYVDIWKKYQIFLFSNLKIYFIKKGRKSNMTFPFKLNMPLFDFCNIYKEEIKLK